jgi:diguanylate cyclase (GGDEF)-like protein/PAS domain S-box-containing protein
LSRVRAFFAFVLALFALATAGPAAAVEAVQVPTDAPALNLSRSLEYYKNLQDRVAVSTAPGPDGIVRRIEVRSSDGSASHWAVLALSNPSDEQIDRLIVSPYFRLARSKLIWPDLGSSRITAITPSQGIAPDRLPSRDADVFRVTLDPGAVVTFVLELKTPRLTQLTLWEPDAYRDSVNAYSLYKGIVLGIAGLLAVFLTIVFVVKGTVMFPATAALAWAVLGYVMIDFYFLDDVLQISVSEDRIYRAGAEVMLALTLVVFLSAYLNLARWHVRYGHAAIGLLVLLVALFGVAVAEPRIAAGVARIALAVIGALGLVLITFMALKGYDRAIMLIPTWLLFGAWLVGAGMAITGGIVNDIIQPALSGGLVLIVLLMGFTVMQHAFAGGSVAAPVSDIERAALALVGSGDPVWDWDVDRDRVHTSRIVETQLGLEPGSLQGAAVEWLDVLHPQDADRFRIVLDAVLDQRRGRVSEVFRLRAADGHFRWFHLRARPIVGADGAVLRCIGTLVDVTDAKTTEERLLHDAVHDNLTGLPNRELCVDRLEVALSRAHLEGANRPIVVALGIDNFHAVNETYGPSIGDSALLTVARRLPRLLKPLDTLARTGGDQFAIIVLSERDPARVAALADEIRRQIRAAITFGEHEISLTCSIGIASAEPGSRSARDLLHDAELAMVHAKRLGGDRSATFTPVLRRLAGELASLESDLGRAIAANEIRLEYVPIHRLPDRAIAGFEVVARWDHPRRGRIDPQATAQLAERAGVVHELALFVVDRSVKLLAEWQEMTPDRDEPLFLWVSLPANGLLTQDLVNDVKSVLGRTEVATGSVWIGVTESSVLENPEQSAMILRRLNDLGAGLALDDIGADWSAIGVLHRMPFDAVRLKTSRLRAGSGTTRPVILQTVAGLAHGLDARLLASAIDTEADLAEVAEVECDFVQGRLFGAAMPVDGVRRLLGKALAKTGS